MEFASSMSELISGCLLFFVYQSCRNPRVFAFEPLPPIFEALRSNAELYDLDTHLFNAGLSNEDKMTSMIFYPKSSVMSGVYADASEDQQVARVFLSNQDGLLSEYADEILEERFKGETFFCRLRTLSDVIKEYQVDRIDLLKIDVEKSELDVLRGIGEGDWSKIKQIVIEVHDIDGRLDQIRELLEQHGYNLSIEQDIFLQKTGLYNLYAIHPSKAQALEGEKDCRVDTRPLLMPKRVSLSTSELRSYLKEALPEYMVPASFVILDKLPMTPSGKLDLRSLPDSEQARPDLVHAYAPARSAAEEILVNHGRKLLGSSE